MAFGIEFEKFAFADQLSKNFTGTFKKNWSSEEIHKITPDNMKPTGQVHLGGILSCFEGAVAFGIDFENFAFAGQLSKNVTGTFNKKLVFSRNSQNYIR